MRSLVARRWVLATAAAPVLISCASVAMAQGVRPTADDWARADAATVRLSPGAFPGIPTSIRAELDRRQCAIPQPSGSSTPRNVISGRLLGRDRTDWAVLCSRDRRSVVLVFTSPDFREVRELAEAADLDFLQTRPGGRIGFSRALLVATPDMVRRTRDEDVPKPANVDHDGIVDAFEGKGSTIWYWFNGKWIGLSGSD